MAFTAWFCPFGRHALGHARSISRAFDTYGELNLADAITLKEADESTNGTDGLSTAVLGGLGLLVLVGAVVVLTLLARRGGGWSRPIRDAVTSVMEQNQRPYSSPTTV